uniref:Uncharacterized protein n=1 Tax=Plectus sambesii TaxID=2011161 RepID=A0A914V6N9_9BILA
MRPIAPSSHPSCPLRSPPPPANYSATNRKCKIAGRPRYFLLAQPVPSALPNGPSSVTTSFTFAAAGLCSNSRTTIVSVRGDENGDKRGRSSVGCDCGVRRGQY